MSSSTAFQSVRRVRSRISVPHLLVTTLVLVTGTILLGVATRAAGAGLACDANWPLCDGGLLNLFPAGFPSFFEWFHRLVAGVAGFFIVGSALLAWVEDLPRRITWAAILGMVLTPIQVTLGRETVLSYDMTVLNLHFWTAIVIFVCFAVATIYSWLDRLDTSLLPMALVVGAIFVPVQVVFSPIVIESYTPVMHTVRDAVSLSLVFAGLLAGILGSVRLGGRRARAISLAPILALTVVYLSRETVMAFDPRIDLLYLLVSAVVSLLLIGASVDTRTAIARHQR